MDNCFRTCSVAENENGFERRGIHKRTWRIPGLCVPRFVTAAGEGHCDTRHCGEQVRRNESARKIFGFTPVCNGSRHPLWHQLFSIHISVCRWPVVVNKLTFLQSLWILQRSGITRGTQSELCNVCDMLQTEISFYMWQPRDTNLH